MSDLGKDLFKSSLKRYESSVRWAFTLLAIGILAHMSFFTKAVRIEKKRHALEQKRDNLAKINNILQGLPAQVEAFNEALDRQEEEVGELGGAVEEALKKRFDALNRIVLRVRRGSDLTRAADSELEREIVEKLEEAGLRAKLRTRSLGELWDEELAAFVEDRLIPPTFEEAQDEWELSPVLLRRAERVKGTISTAVHAFENQWPEPDSDDSDSDDYRYEMLDRHFDRLERLRTEIDNALASVRRVEFEPPETDEDWWSSEVKKGEALDDMVEAITEKMYKGVGTKEATVATVKEELRQLMDEHEETITSLSERLDEMTENVQNGIASIGGLEKSWITAGFDIRDFVLRFPLLVAILLAICIVWPTYRRSTLTRAVILMSKEGDESDGDRFLQKHYADPAALLNGILLLVTVGGIAWIWYAQHVVGTLPEALLDSNMPAQAQTVSAIAGTIVLVLAVAYRVFVIVADRDAEVERAD